MEIEVDTEDVCLKNIDNIEEYNDLEIIKAETLSIIKAIEDDGIDLSDTYEISHILSAIDFKSLEDCAIEIDALFSGLNPFTFFNTSPTKIAIAIPNRYRDTTIIPPLAPKKAAVKSPYTGSLAPQDINGVIAAVIFLELSSSIVLVA